MESLYLLILAFVIIIIIFPFTFNIKVSYDLKLNDGYLVIKVRRVILQSMGLKRRGRNIILVQKKKNENLEVEVSSEQLRFLQVFLTEVENKIRIRKLEIGIESGVKDPFKSAMFSSFLSAIILVAFARLKTKQPTAAFKLKNNTNFYDFAFDVKSLLRVSISIFDVIYSLILSILKSGEDRKVNKRI